MIYRLFSCLSLSHNMYVEYKTKVSRNSNMSKLQAGYLFPEVCYLLLSWYYYLRFEIPKGVAFIHS